MPELVPTTVNDGFDFSRRAAELCAAIESNIDTGDNGMGPATEEADEDGDALVVRGAGRASPNRKTVVDEGDAE